MQHVTELSIDEALRDVAHRRRMARLLHDPIADLVLSRQLDRLLDMKNAQRDGVECPEAIRPMIHR